MPADSILRRIRHLFTAKADAGATDADLLRRFADVRDDAAFELLVWRHAALVLALCRRMLRHAEDAQDTFQATFAVLSRKRHRIVGRQTIGGWLHGVGYRVALNGRRRAAQRWAKEHRVEDMPPPPVLPEEPSRDWTSAPGLRHLPSRLDRSGRRRIWLPLLPPPPKPWVDARSAGRRSRRSPKDTESSSWQDGTRPG